MITILHKDTPQGISTNRSEFPLSDLKRQLIIYHSDKTPFYYIRFIPMLSLRKTFGLLIKSQIRTVSFAFGNDSWRDRDEAAEKVYISQQ